MTNDAIDDLVLGLVGSRLDSIALMSINALLPDDIGYRKVDRALQRLRRAGKIRFAGAKTGWVLV